MNSWSYDRYAVLGLGRTGKAVIEALRSDGKQVIAVDQNPNILPEALPADVELRAGTLDLSGSDACVVSPGFPPSRLSDVAVPVISELDLAYDRGMAPLISVTGTDGKTTTTELIAHILKTANHRTIAAGNIGIPLTELFQPRFGSFDVVVAEVSAFQMWSADRYRSEISVFTNVAEDHVDYFDTFEEYVEAKRRLIAHCLSDDIAVFNADDPRVVAFADSFAGEARFYGLSKPRAGSRNMWVDGGQLVIDGEPVISLADIPLVGTHNALNVMAAILACDAWNVDHADIVDAVTSFRASPHRCQPLGTVVGRHVYDDSKATNAHAAMAGLRDLPDGLVAIVGGVDKGLDLTPWAELLKSKARHVVVIGAIRERLSKELSAVGFGAVTAVDTLVDAVDAAFDESEIGTTIILSPGCSSFDMFDSYADRGRQFQAAIAARR